MASNVSTVEALILKATDVLSKENDPNAMQKISQAIVTEQGGIETAVRLIAHKMQSPQEWEAMQALLVLQSCVNNCGPEFQAEIGKFKFLNEMIKIISPKFLGLQRPAKVKEKVIQLLYTWTVDLPRETKIDDAYKMLKKQDIIKNDPPYLGVRTPSDSKPKSTFKDEEKTRVLQKLLQSKSPLDISKANTLIKHMVKEDERRMEKTARRSIEVETAMTNVNVLDDMITQYEKNPGDTADLDLMVELKASCKTLQTSIYRLVADTDDEDEGIGKLLKTNDELSRVLGRYKAVVKPSQKPMNGIAPPKNEDTLLDLAPEHIVEEVKPPTGLSEINFLDTKPASPPKSSLDDILGLCEKSFTKLDISSTEPSKLSPLLVPERPQEVPSPKAEEKPSNPFDDLDLIGSTLIKENLPAHVQPTGSQFKPQEKVSMNQLIGQKHVKDASLLVPSSRCSSSSDSSVVLSNASSLINPSKPPLSSSNSSLSSMDLNSVPENQTKSETVSEQAQLALVKPMTDLHINLEDVQPSSQLPLKLIDSNDVNLSLHFTDNHPRDDVSVIVVSVTSSNKQPITNYVLQAVVPKGCKARLLPPSATSMAAYSPFLPPPAITQILLIANPNKLNIFLKMMLSYSIEDDLFTEMGEVQVLPL